MKKQKLSGGQVMARMLRAEGVEVVFGIIDGTYFGFYASLADQGIRLITPRHETSAVHMAGAYARVTGKLGVCMASNGPGVANALPGIAVENAEGNRVLMITSSRREGIAYPDRGGTYQCFDQVAVTTPMTKWAGTAGNFARVPEMMKKALRASFSGRPGVVHIDVPESVINTPAEFDVASLGEPQSYRSVEPRLPHPEQVTRAAELLINAKQPLIHAGTGVIHAGASAELRRLAELLSAPVTTSWSGRAAIVETIPQAISMIDVDLCTRVRNEADVALILGSRVGETDWWGKPPYWRKPSEQKTIQVDLDEQVIGLNKPVELGIVADLKAFLVALIDVVSARKAQIDFGPRQVALAGYFEQLSITRGQLAEKLEGDPSPMHPGQVATICQKVFRDDTLLVIDGGNTAIWANFYHQVRRPNTVLSTFKFGMLGAGVSQALGAQVAAPDKRVCCIIGDGAMGFHPQEVETAVRNNLKPIYLVLCDRQWGMVKINQQFALKPLTTFLTKSLPESDTINTDLGEIRFDDLARSMGAHGERVDRASDLAPAIKRALAADRCAVIHVDVDRVAHMWAPALKHFKDMHQEPQG